MSCVYPALPDSITLLALRPGRISSGWLVSLFQGNNLSLAWTVMAPSVLEYWQILHYVQFVRHCLRCDHRFPSHRFPRENRQFLIPLLPLALASPQKNQGACTLWPLLSKLLQVSQAKGIAMSLGLTVSSLAWICPKKSRRWGKETGNHVDSAPWQTS